MGRKIGSYVDPESGETHYMDVGNLAKLAIIPEQVVRFKDDRNTLVNFRAVENEKEHAVMIYADYEYRGEKITSEPIFIDEEALANEMFECVFADNTIDAAPSMIEAKKLAVQSIGEKLLARGVLLSSAVINGIGFICSSGARMMTIERLDVQVLQNGTAKITLRDCVGNAQLKNVIEPSIEFFTGTHRIFIDKFSVEEEKGLLIRDCKIAIAEFSSEPTEEVIDYKEIKIDPENESSIEELVLARRALLDSAATDLPEEPYDDRFADLL